MRGVRIQVLGPVRVWRHDQELDLGPAGRRAVLGLLVLARGHPLTRAELVDALWGDKPPATATNVLQTHVKHLRRQLEPDRRSHAPSRLLPSVGDGYALRVADDGVDLARFRVLANAAVVAVREHDPVRVASLSEQALRLWQGGPLADVPVLAGHPKVLALVAERQATQARYCDAMLAVGAGAEVLPLIEETASANPLDEAAQARLIRAYQAVGQRAQAFAAYRAARTRLAEELGIDPGPALAAAHAELLSDPDHPVRPAPPTVPADAAPAQPQATATPAATPASAEPPGTATPAPIVVPAQLPADVYGFTGRRTELRLLDQLLPGPTDNPGHDNTGHDNTGHDNTGRNGTGRNNAGRDGTGHDNSGSDGPRDNGTEGDSTASGPVVVAAICGTAGVGKPEPGN